MQTASRLCDYKYIIIIIIIYSYTPYVHNLKFLNVTLLQSYKVTKVCLNRHLPRYAHTLGGSQEPVGWRWSPYPHGHLDLHSHWCPLGKLSMHYFNSTNRLMIISVLMKSCRNWKSKRNSKPTYTHSAVNLWKIDKKAANIWIIWRKVVNLHPKRWQKVVKRYY